MSIAHVGLAIELGSEPIQGSVQSGCQEPRAFCGWVELAAAIEAVRAIEPAQLDPGVRAAKD